MAEPDERFVDHVEWTIECPRKVLMRVSENEWTEADVEPAIVSKVNDAELLSETVTDAELLSETSKKSESSEEFIEEFDKSFTDRSEETIEGGSPSRIDFKITTSKKYELNSQQNEIPFQKQDLDDEQNNNSVLSVETDGDTVIQIQEAITELVPPAVSADAQDSVMNRNNNAMLDLSIEKSNENNLPEKLEERNMLENINNNNAISETCMTGVNEIELNEAKLDSLESATTLVDNVVSGEKGDRDNIKCVSKVNLQVAVDDTIVQLDTETSEDAELELARNEDTATESKKVINLSEARSEVVVDYQTVVVTNQLTVNDMEVNEDDYVVISTDQLKQEHPQVSHRQQLPGTETDSKLLEVTAATREQNQITTSALETPSEPMIRSFGTQDYREQNKDIFEPMTEQIQQEELISPTTIGNVETTRTVFGQSEIIVQEADKEHDTAYNLGHPGTHEISITDEEFNTVHKLSSPQSIHSTAVPINNKDGSQSTENEGVSTSETDDSLQISEETIEQVISELNQRTMQFDIEKHTNLPVEETISAMTSLQSEAVSTSRIEERKEVPPIEPIEVERKFTFTEKSEEKVLQLGCNLIREEQFLDIYFDNSDYSLTLKDIWLRQRNHSWEMKVPLSDHGIENFSTQYMELDKEKDIVEHLAKLFEVSSKSLSDIILSENIEKFAEFTTIRKIYAHAECTICLDAADFGFQVGEIEVMVSSKSRIPHALKTIESVANKLGMSPLEIEQVSVL